MIMITNVIANH